MTMSVSSGDLIAASPKLEEVQRLVMQAQESAHPRLLRRADQMAALRARLARDPAVADYFACVRAEADRVLSQPPVEHKPIGRRLLHVSRQALERVAALGFAWRLTGEKVYADRGIDELRAVCAFTDWGPNHFLDVAEMSLAVGIGYDWFYDAMSPDFRKTVRTALKEKALELSEEGNPGWVRASNNWGQVCHAGIVAGALALLETDPELAARIVHRAIVNVPTSMAAYAPDGGYPEGPGYWDYGTLFNVILIELLDGVLGTDFALSDLPGFAETGIYIQVAHGPTAIPFNYADGWPRRNLPSTLFWFADRFGTPVDPLWRDRMATAWRNRGTGKRAESDVGTGRFALGFLWLPPEPEAGQAAAAPLPLDWQDRGPVPVAMHRSAWGDPRALFVGVKAGSPSHNHGQMDGGSFVLDADGVRWAYDLGAENYHRIESRGMNLWNQKQESDRWRIFRQSNLSHNTLVIDGRLQVAAGKATIAQFSADENHPFTRLDLSPLYAGQATSVERTVSMPDRKAIVIRDRLTGLNPGSRVRWGMVTQAEAELDGPQAVLTRNGERLVLQASGGEPMVWSLVDTATPQAEYDSPNPGTRMIALEVEAPPSGDLLVEVHLLPGSTQRLDLNKER